MESSPDVSDCFIMQFFPPVDKGVPDQERRLEYGGSHLELKADSDDAAMTCKDGKIEKNDWF